MKCVRVTANGGLSVLSAFSTGRGSAVSIDLKMKVDLVPSSNNNENTRMINRTISYLNRKLSLDRKYIVKVSSDIPTANGLKSSSALTVSIVAGILFLNGITMEDEELLTLASEASIYNHTSLTGATDDLCASFHGGLCLTDNNDRKILKRERVEELPVVIAATTRSRKTAALKKHDFSGLRSSSERIERLVNEDRFMEAMALNGFAYGSILGMNLSFVSYFLTNGAICSSQSGKGPAVFGVFSTEDEAERAMGHFPRVPYYKPVRASFSNRPIEVKGYDL